MDIQVKNSSGSQIKQITLSDSIFKTEVSDHVLHGVVKAYRANRRQGTHATKTRSMVSGGGKKPFKQKGTGGARQGTSRSPNMPGGAVVHGPQPRDYTQKVNIKTKKLALKMVLSDKVRHGKLVVVDDFGLSKCSTKTVATFLKSLNVKSALLLDERKDKLLYLSTRNLKNATASSPSDINAEDLLRYDSVVISENGLNVLNRRLGE